MATLVCLACGDAYEATWDCIRESWVWLRSVGGSILMLTSAAGGGDMADREVGRSICWPHWASNQRIPREELIAIGSLVLCADSGVIQTLGPSVHLQVELE